MHIQQSETSSRRLSSRQQSSNMFPFTFAYRTIAHEGHPERNEDALLVDRRRGLAGVFDGVGGSSAGAVASQLGARIMRQTWRRVLSQAENKSDLLILNGELDIESLLQQLFEQAQTAISNEGERRAKEAAQANYSYPSTTTVVAALCKKADEKGYEYINCHGRRLAGARGGSAPVH